MDTRCSCLGTERLIKGVTLEGFTAPCMFHKRIGERRDYPGLLPDGICPDLLYLIYPQYLSLLYGGLRGTAPLAFQCPGGGAVTSWRLSLERYWFAPALGWANRLLRWLGQPKDFIQGRIVLRLEQGHPDCPWGYRSAKVHVVDQYREAWRGALFCPAVFYGLYPYLASGPSPSGPACARCPADNTCISFKAELRADGAGHEKG